MSRAERRANLSDARRVVARAKDEQRDRRRSGDWPPWVRHAVAPGEVGGDRPGGWTRDVHTAHANGVYAVLVRTVATAWGPVEHAAITTLAGGDVPWRDKQRIKDEIFGAERVAVEVFPPAGELVDAADAYHIWVLPVGMHLPFTIGARP